MPKVRLVFVLLFVCARLAFSQDQSSLQRFRTFYTVDAAEVPAGLQSLPVSSTPIRTRASDGAIWTGSAHGLVRNDPNAAPADRMQVFAGLRYLPDDEVLAIEADQNKGVWVRCRSGISHIELRPLTLLDKSQHFENRVRLRHDRWGMVASSRLRTPGDLSTNQLTSTDNDGLWTAMYAAAECFRYAKTRSPEALAAAKKAIEAVLFLEQITGKPGFPARSYIRKGETQPSDGVWHPTPDGSIVWKGDTSSDEIVGHFFLFSVAWDTLDDPQLKQRISEVSRRIMDHILSNRYQLIDVTGKPTYWGRWDLEYFATKKGKPDSPLNAAELLSFLKTAHHITGDAKYDREYRKVALELGYADIATRQRELCPEINYSDEELAMLSFYPLFRYEKDAKLLASYRKAAGDWWHNIQREQNPLWIYIYALVEPSAKKHFPEARHTLERFPMDLVTWTVKNSERTGIAFDPKLDRFNKRQVVTFLPPDERPIMKWNGNPFVIDGGNGGRSEDDGAIFLLPYWMGRYFGFLEN